MKLGLCTIAFRDRPLEEVISIADDYGFDGIEIWGQEPHMPATYDSEYIECVRKLIEGRDLEVSAYGSYVNPLLDRHQQHFEEAYKIADGLGTDIVRVWSKGGSSKSITSDTKRTIFFRFTSLAHWAQFRDLTLGLEMHNNNFTDSIDSILELFEYVRVPAIKTYFQPSFRSDADDPYEAVEKLGDHIVNVHAQNANADGQGCAIADGVVDYEKIVQKLADVGYDGYIEIEFLHGDDKLEALQRDRDYLASLIDTIEAS